MLALDTCVVVEVLRGDKAHYATRLQEAEDARQGLIISSFVLHELSYGAMISPQPQVQLRLIDAFVARTPVEPWTAEDALVAARVRADLKRVGIQTRTVDSLLAGQALSRDWIVVTSNVKDFVRVPDLKIIDWSNPAGAREIDAKAWMLAHLRRPPKEEK